MYTKLKSTLSSLIDLHVPVVTDRRAKPSAATPGSLKSDRKRAWLTYKSARVSFGRHSPHLSLALENYNLLNERYRNYQIYSQIELERSLIDKMKDCPKLIHQYIRGKVVLCRLAP